MGSSYNKRIAIKDFHTRLDHLGSDLDLVSGVSSFHTRHPLSATARGPPIDISVTHLAEYQPNCRKGLCRLLLCNQHLVGSGGDLHGVLEQGCKAGEAVFPAVEAKHELVQIGLHMLFPKPMIDAERPALQV
jgi:hypothetical protein